MNEQNDTLWHEIIKLEQDIPIRIFRSYDTEHSLIIPHFHDAIEIIYLSHGTLLVMDNTQHTILTEGNFHIFNSNSVHSTNFKGDVLEGIVLQISYSFVKRIFPAVDTLNFSESFSSSQEKIFFIKYLQQLLLIMESTEKLKYLDAYSLLFLILKMLISDYSRELSVKELNVNKKYFQRIQLISNYIDNNFHKQITLNEISNLVHLNPSYLSRFIKKNYGLTFYDYLTNIRLNYVYNQLTQTTLPIMQIIEESGFSSYPQFHKEFIKRYKKQPRALRKSDAATKIETDF